MNNIEGFTILNIRDYLQNDNEIGEADLKQLISDFSCPLNPDVEKFLTKNAIEFTKKNQSVTYLVFTTEDAVLVGYFTLAIKPITLSAEGFSNNVKRKLARVSELDAENNTFALSAYLIAQLGKNFTGEANKRISGQQLLEVAMETVYDLQFMAGGMVVFLEAENHPKLLNFYDEENGFKEFEIKEVQRAESESHTLVQMLKIL